VAATIDEWDGADATMGLEDDAIFTGGAARWIDGYPTSLYVIR
jgi:hypothetical protein